jgi:O-antigen ligase
LKVKSLNFRVSAFKFQLLFHPMPIVSSIFFVAALVLAVVIGPQTRAWTWGPALLALGISVSAALPVFWRKDRPTLGLGLSAFCTLVAAWFGWRAWASPVPELGLADLLLLAGCVGTFLSIRAIEGNAVAERILIWGIALLLLANIGVVAKQVLEPGYAPVFRSRAGGFPTGFFAHYNEAANYLIASSLLVAAAAWFGRHATATRVFFGLIAIAGLAAVYFTRSRGGILGAAIGSGVFVAIAMAIGKRQRARWFGLALIAIPVVAFAIAAFVFNGWQDSQHLRLAGSSIAQLLDNNCRLYYLGVALSCIGLHPLFGGGGRSFSWENFKFANAPLQGDMATHQAEQVHNELLQAATDYGIIGAGLLIGLVGSLVVISLVRVLVPKDSKEFQVGDAWRLGGMAALAGMFVQSCFSFDFHLFPGVLLLGICLGQLSCGVSAPCPRVLQIWPHATFYLEQATLLQTAAAADPSAASPETLDRAIHAYEKAGQLNRFDPTPVVNRANLLSFLRRDREAENAFNLAIRLQGGMEPAFRAHFSFARHLTSVGRRQSNPAEAKSVQEAAAQQMEQAVKQMHWVVQDMPVPRVAVHENLGLARERCGDVQAALHAYDFAAALRKGSKAHYHAGVLLGRMASKIWAQNRPAEAYGYFIESKRRIGLAKELPQNVTAAQRAEFIAYVDRGIQLMKTARIKAVPYPPSKP